MRDQLPYSETGCRNVTRALSLVMDEYVNRPAGIRKRAIRVASSYSRFQSHHGLPVLVLLLPEPEAQWDHELHEASKDSLLA